MIDEFFQRAAPKVGRVTVQVVNGTGNALFNALAAFSAWYEDFRWVEFSAACTGAMAAGITMATSMGLPETIARKVGIFGAVVTGLAFIRSPKTKWRNANTFAEDGDRSNAASEGE